jgi:hypothetical protein
MKITKLGLTVMIMGIVPWGLSSNISPGLGLMGIIVQLFGVAGIFYLGLKGEIFKCG